MPLLDCAAGLIATLIKNGAIPTAIPELKDGVPIHRPPLHIPPDVRGRRSHAAEVFSATGIPPSSFRDSPFGKNLFQSRPAAHLRVIPELEGCLWPGAITAGGEEIIRQHFSQSRPVALFNRPAEGGEERLPSSLGGDTLLGERGLRGEQGERQKDVSCESHLSPKEAI